MRNKKEIEREIEIIKAEIELLELELAELRGETKDNEDKVSKGKVDETKASKTKISKRSKTELEFRTLELSERLEPFNGNLREFDCRGISCLDCPFYYNNKYCVDFDKTDLKLLSKEYLSLPLKQEE